MISARRRAQEEIQKRVEEELKQSLEKQARLAAQKAQTEKELEVARRSLELKKQQLRGGGAEKPVLGKQTSEPLVQVADNRQEGEADDDEWEYEY